MNRARFLRYAGTATASALLSRDTPRARAASVATSGSPSLTTFIHYYPWYANAPSYRHWNGGDPTRIDPRDNIAAASYPLLGPYNNKDSSGTIDQHLRWLEAAGIDVLILSWWGQGSYEDAAAAVLLTRATAHGVGVCFQIEPYLGRTPASTVADISYLYARFGALPAFHRVSRPTLASASHERRGMFFLYAPSGPGWSRAIQTLRGTPDDAIILVRTDDRKMLADADVRDQIEWTGADGMYNYGCYEASGTYNVRLPSSPDYVLVFTACPGFDNSRASGVVHPSVVSRNNGVVYDASWSQLAIQKPEGVAVVSFNEWHEGTQIEPAVPHQYGTYSYLDYEGGYGMTGTAAASAYLSRTSYWARRYKSASVSATSFSIYLPALRVN